MREILDEGLTFDDVLLLPKYNDIRSRQDVLLETRIVRGGPKIAAPLLSANMDTITESVMMSALSDLGCAGVMHRFMSPEKAEKEIYRTIGQSPNSVVCVSLGVGDDSSELIDVYKGRVHIVCIDVAHGHSQAVIDMIKHVKKALPGVGIIAGNVATSQGTHDLIEAGADAIKVGIGPGSLCTTRLVTGNGRPQLTAIMECVAVASRHDVPVIADGGMRTSGDVVKALAAGAETVMSGSFFSGTDETPGEFVYDGDKKYKKYQGMASKDAMIGWKGRGYHAAPEGEATLIPAKGPVSKIVDLILAGIRSGMTYQGAHNLEGLRRDPVFQKISPNCLTENKAHGK